MILQGIGTNGLAMGEAYVVQRDMTTGHSYQKGSCEEELHSATEALQKAKEHLLKLAGENDIFSAHFEIADDPALQEVIESNIRVNDMSAPDAIEAASKVFENLFKDIDDAYLQARADDVRDVCMQIKAFIRQSSQKNPFHGISHKCILVTNELLPSDIPLLNFDNITGIITSKGNPTSHVCIIASNKGIPALVGTAHCTETIKSGDCLLLDADNGKVHINPSPDCIHDFELKAGLQKHDQAEAVKNARLTAVTIGGRVVPVLANAGSPNDIRKALESGADGIGLLRSEFLFMEQERCPDEETQIQAYTHAAKLCRQQSLTIRTLDIGGDKLLPYMPLPHEDNPFLGLRGIRLTLAHVELFKTQIRAILRASSEGNIQIMLPFISDILELEHATELIEECKKELDCRHIAYDKMIKTGIMVETPSVVLLASEFASRVDFFSIGTNDLTQYIMAADRGNNQVSKYYNSTHPALLKAMQLIASAAHQHNIPVSVCGELASDPNYTHMLLNIGIDRLSVNSSAIPLIKEKIRNYK